MIKRYIVLLLLCLVPLVADNFRNAVKAHRQGNFQLAKTLFQLAMDKDESIHAGYMLGRMYLYGQGVKKDLNKAVELFTFAQEYGNIPAGCYLSETYMKLGTNSSLLAKGIVPGLNKNVPYCKTVYEMYKKYSFPAEFHFD